MSGLFILDPPPLVYVTGFVILVLYIRSRLRFSAYDSIPAVGYSSPLLSYITALQFYVNPNKLLEEGYANYHGAAFKIPFLNSWHVVVPGSKLIDELRQAKDGELSMLQAVVETMQLQHTMGDEATKTPANHTSIVRNELTRNINNVLPDIHDELEQCFPEIIPLTDEWKSITAMGKILQIVARVNGRVSVGVPACRDEEYLNVSITYTTKVVIYGRLLAMIPSFLRGIAAKNMAFRQQSIDVVLKHVGPVIEERHRNMEIFGKDWVGKPNDMLQWLLDSPNTETDSISSLAQRLLILSFVSIHTTSMALTNALYRLALNPEYLHPLRDEAASAIAEWGWTKAGIQKMRNADSFLKECQRLHGFESLNMERLALEDFTFKDGTVIPKGAFVSVAQRIAHTDPDYYDNPLTFDPWRFSKGSEEEGGVAQQTATKASLEYVSFGLGKHACPGRFFAMAELKAILAWLVLHYDVKMENEGVFPAPMYIQAKSPPNPNAKVLFRRRCT
ncbi:cytochrome P450 [Irpex lacteus]|nr:cytochrome P450 [Irpex lacteus]